MDSLYYDPSTGFQSESKFYHRVKHLGYKYRDVQEFLREQRTHQLNKQTRRPRQFRSIQAKYPGDCFQMDVLVYTRHRMNHYEYILCCIDVYSRYAAARALTNLRATTLLENIRSIFEEIGVPANLNFDQEFSTPKILLDYFEVQGITLYASETDELHKNAIVERFNRTLAALLQRWRTGQTDRRWYKVLPLIIENYNSTYHRTIKARPVDVFNRRDFNHQQIVTKAPTIDLGDTVRVRLVRKVFDKADRLRYSEDIYRVIEALTAARFRLLNLRTQQIPQRSFKVTELLKVKYQEPQVNEKTPSPPRPPRPQPASERPQRDRRANQFHQDYIPFAG